MKFQTFSAKAISSDFLPQIDPAKCFGCGLCVKLCPNDVLARVQDIAIVSAPEACHYSGICQEICPTEAINLTYEIVISGENRRKRR